eukprot:SAG11_NODE_329_length_10681_cov_7.861274_3_plen_61_part_00
MAEAESKYALVYDVMRLAPSFGRSRGRLRGAADGSVLLGARLLARLNFSKKNFKPYQKQY